MEEEKSRTCQNCGEPFEPTCHTTRQKFCSDSCRVQYNNAKRYFDVAPNVCPNCGETIEHGGMKGNRRRFCNEKCRRTYNDMKRQEKQRAAAEVQSQRVCPNCGKDFKAEWKSGTRQRFCCDACRITYWDAYHKVNPLEKLLRCIYCGQEFQRGKHNGVKYCSRNCYLQAAAKTHIEQRCAWCGEAFPCYARDNRRYCGRSCANATRHAKFRAAQGTRLITTRQPKAWRHQLALLAKNTRDAANNGCILLACGARSIGSQDLLSDIIRYELKRDPFNGDRYVFCDGNKLKWIEWDGAAFCVGSRRAERGTYPWPSAKDGDWMEITEREFAFLRSKSIGEKSEEIP